ncbi:MAG: PocR ligand-binding domain-containing protein [Limnochordia bacterium]|jgi:two-component system response regulator YesN|nr:PocR ligand-binding domain-containing protein [Bacillota bacterium]NLH30695.1 helix-turn-helix domain-containing protein [Bacillota bacterium]HOB08503.1 PocR ligand-binding domain-containing protein [Limnochordia bacterium]
MIQEIRQWIDHYSKATGVSSFIIDGAGSVVYHALKSCSPFCEAVQDGFAHLCDCANVHLYGSYQAERFGGRYIYFCPMGLTHWVAPINRGEEFKGAFVGGPVMMIEPEAFLLDEIIEQQIPDQKARRRLRAHMDQIPVIKPDVVTSLSELLYLLAGYAAADDKRHLPDPMDSPIPASDPQTYLGGARHKNYPIDKENELISHVAVGDKAGSLRVLNEILGYVFFTGQNDFEDIKYRSLELVVLLSRAAMEGGAEQEEIFGLNNQYLNQVSRLHNIEELSVWLSRILTRFTDCVFNFKNVKNKDIIYKAIEFTNNNYMERLTLEDAASYVHLSPAYFSRLFKEETGYNFTTYLNTVRIEKSKNLLVNEAIPLADVSSLVGFEDQSYFTRVFKKMTGTTPGKFRETRGQIK